jgi:hypothetical protein
VAIEQEAQEFGSKKVDGKIKDQVSIHGWRISHQGNKHRVKIPLMDKKEQHHNSFAAGLNNVVRMVQLKGQF